MATFHWLVLQTPTGTIDVRGPWNTKEGRDKEFVINNDFWQNAGITVIPFETEGKKKADAFSMGKALIEQSAAPQTEMPSGMSSSYPEVETSMQQYSQPSAPVERSVASISRPAAPKIEAESSMDFEGSLEDEAASFGKMNMGTPDFGPEQNEGVAGGWFDYTMENAISDEVNNADALMQETFSGLEPEPQQRAV